MVPNFQGLGNSILWLLGALHRDCATCRLMTALAIPLYAS